jgi:DNA-binding transcriptional ArsR family regulator
MVKHRVLDSVFSALSDPVRREIVERLTRGDFTAGEIASGFAISQPAISRHIKVLEQCGLVKRKVVGREHHLHLSPRSMRAAAQWIEAQERFWNEAFDRLDALLTQPSERTNKK